MKWIKHYSGSLGSESLADLIRETGFEGYGRYWALLEHLAHLLKDESTSFRVPIENVRGLLRIRSWTELDTFCEQLSTVSGLEIKRNGTVYEIEAPILLELQGRDFKKARAEIQSPASKKENKSKSKTENKKETIGSVDPSDAGKPSPAPAKKDPAATEENVKIWAAYRDAYLKRYKVEPIRNATVNGQISNLKKRVGADIAVELVSFYLASNNSYYVGKCHPVGLCLVDAESLVTQMRKGRAITQTDIRRFEKEQGIQAMLDDANKGGF